ncbi:hypothetical protein [Rhodopseudomonas palustris]|nr:hypothetical protein [Rhodopseudomonas palustris]
MVTTNLGYVNNSRGGDISRDGFDRDLSIDACSRPFITLPAGIAAGIDLLWGDTDTTADRRSLASRGATFADNENINNQLDNANEGRGNAKIEESNAEVSETKHRYDLKHAVVRMLRTGLSEDERSHAVCGCGAAAYDRDEDDGARLQIPVHRNDAGRAWVSGVYRCKSGWLCPTCAPAVARKRQEAVREVVKATTEADGMFLMGLVTVHHVKKDKLADVKKLVTDSFAAARRQKNWARAAEEAGVAGVLVAPEVTYGRHGWHFHLHFGVSCISCDGDDELTDAESEAIEDAALAAGRILIENFRAQVAKRGGTTVIDGQGIEIAASPEAASDYIAKGTSWELAGGVAHKSDAKGQTIWQIVEDADAGDTDAYARFREYAEVMPGTRSCVITAKLRETLNLPADDELGGDQQFEDGGQVVGHLDTFTWLRFLRTKLAGTFLSRIETVSGDISGDGFERLVAETTADADRQEGIIILKRAAKVQRNAADEAAGHAEVRRIITRNIAYHVLHSAKRDPLSINRMIEQRIASLRADGHPEAAMPLLRGVLADLFQMRECVVQRAA